MQECRETVLVVAAREGSVQIVRKLVQHGATATSQARYPDLSGGYLYLLLLYVWDK